MVSIDTESEYALYEFVTPASLCAPEGTPGSPNDLFKRCTTTPLTQVTYTQPIDEKTGNIRIDRDLVIRVTSMQERLRQIDASKYGELDLPMSDRTSPSYTAPRQTPGLLEAGRNDYSIQHFRVNLKTVAYIFVTANLNVDGLNHRGSEARRMLAESKSSLSVSAQDQDALKNMNVHPLAL